MLGGWLGFVYFVIVVVVYVLVQLPWVELLSFGCWFRYTAVRTFIGFISVNIFSLNTVFLLNVYRFVYQKRNLTLFFF